MKFIYSITVSRKATLYFTYKESKTVLRKCFKSGYIDGENPLQTLRSHNEFTLQSKKCPKHFKYEINMTNEDYHVIPCTHLITFTLKLLRYAFFCECDKNTKMLRPCKPAEQMPLAKSAVQLRTVNLINTNYVPNLHHTFQSGIVCRRRSISRSFGETHIFDGTRILFSQWCY